MPAWLIQFIIPFAVNAVKDYIKNTDSKSDDKVLDVVKLGANYLAVKHNNSVTDQIAESLRDTSMILTQKPK